MTTLKPYYAAWLEDSDDYYVHSLCETEEEVYTFLEGLNLSVPLGDSGVRVVEISKQLFDYLQEVLATKPFSITVTGKGYQPSLPTIPYTDLNYSQEKLALRELRWKEMQREDSRLLGMKNDDSLRFQPWQPILKKTHSQIVYNQDLPWYSESLATQHTRIVEEDSRELDTKGIYLTHLTGKQDIEKLTTSRVLSRRETKGTSNFFGVSDNATQVKAYLEKALEVYFTSNSASGGTLYWLGKHLARTLDYYEGFAGFGYVLLLSPIWNKHDVSNYGGFRWSKWGNYIGKYERQSDYLDHETGLDFVFVWNLVPVVRD